MFGQFYIDLRNYFDAGGPVLWPILGATIILWTAILERYWYLFLVFPGRRDKVVAEWEARADTTSWRAKWIREKMISEVRLEVNRSVLMIKTLIALIPLLGLLGTVTGMTEVFQVLAALGSANARAMANGVSATIIPTMSALTVSVFTLYFAFSIERRVNNAVEDVEDRLRHF